MPNGGSTAKDLNKLYQWIDSHKGTDIIFSYTGEVVGKANQRIEIVFSEGSKGEKDNFLITTHNIQQSNHIGSFNTGSLMSPTKETLSNYLRHLVKIVENVEGELLKTFCIEEDNERKYRRSKENILSRQGGSISLKDLIEVFNLVGRGLENDGFEVKLTNKDDKKSSLTKKAPPHKKSIELNIESILGEGRKSKDLDEVYFLIDEFLKNQGQTDTHAIRKDLWQTIKQYVWAKIQEMLNSNNVFIELAKKKGGSKTLDETKTYLKEIDDFINEYINQPGYNDEYDNDFRRIENRMNDIGDLIKIIGSGASQSPSGNGPLLQKAA